MNFDDLAKLWFLYELNIDPELVDLAKSGVPIFNFSGDDLGGCATCGPDIELETNIYMSTHFKNKSHKDLKLELINYTSFTPILKSILEFELSL